LCPVDFDFTSFHTLEQQTFKLAAILWALEINIAFATGKCRAGLPELFDTGLRFFRERQSECPQARGVVVTAQLHVGENDPVAAQAAFEA